MRTSERILITAFSHFIRKGRAGDITDVRALFDKRYASEPAEWRQRIWAAAAERAARKDVSR